MLWPEALTAERLSFKRRRSENPANAYSDDRKGKRETKGMCDDPTEQRLVANAPDTWRADDWAEAMSVMLRDAAIQAGPLADPLLHPDDRNADVRVALEWALASSRDLHCELHTLEARVEYASCASVLMKVAWTTYELAEPIQRMVDDSRAAGASWALLSRHQKLEALRGVFMDIGRAHDFAGDVVWWDPLELDGVVNAYPDAGCPVAARPVAE